MPYVQSVLWGAVLAALAAGAPEAEPKKPKKKQTDAPPAAAAPVSAARIRDALAKGGAYLGGVAADDKSLPDFRYPLGARALYAAALVSAGKGVEDPVVARLYRSLEALPMTRVYCASLVAIALDVRFKEFVRSAGGERAPARMTGRDQALLARAVNWVLAAQVASHGGWSYVRAPQAGDYDLSNTQFAVLALAIGQRHGVKIPAQALERCVKACAKLQVADSGAHEAAVAYQIDLAAPEKSRPCRSLTGTPAGWVYAPGSRSSYFAMTAAAVGNLFVARKFLPGAARELDAAADQGLLWLDRHWDSFAAQHAHEWKSLTRNYYYTLYSLEKALDLGEIACLGARDWYQEEAAHLLASQNADGSWGADALKPVATSFALLFLSRATAATPLMASAPVLYTGPGAESDHDRVHVDKLGGYVSAKGFLASVAASEDPRLIPLAREVIASYAPDRRESLVPALAELLASRSDAIKRFGAQALTTLTGIANPTSESVAAWRATYDKIAGAEKARDMETLRALVAEQLNATLFERMVRAIESAKARELASDLARAMGAGPPERRERLHRALCFLTGERMPYDAATCAATWEKYLREKARAGG